MKETILLLFFILAVFIPQSGFSAGLDIGVTTAYTWWSPAFQDKINGNSEKSFIPPTFSPVYNQSFTMNNGMGEFLLGPAISFSFLERWSISGFFLVSPGTYDAIGSYSAKHIGLVRVYNIKIEFNFRRYDADIALQYRINRYIKLICGYKNNIYSGTGTYSYYATEAIKDTIKLESFSLDTGPAIGTSFTIPVYKTLYILPGATVSYLYGTTDDGTSTTIKTTNSHLIVLNPTVSFAYYFSTTGITLSLGGRYQFAYNFNKESVTQFYGFTINLFYRVF